MIEASDRLRAAYLIARDALLAERVPAGHWVGELSTSALSTATAVMALHLANPFEHRERIDAGVKWLVNHENDDGGWGDTTKSFSNISTTMLCRAALRLTGAEKDQPATVEKVEAFLNLRAGRSQEQRAEAIRRRYGKDRTFSVPILMSCALAGLVPWNEVPRLPFEAAALPQSWYRFARMPVVSYALPALIAIGQCVYAKRGTWNPIAKLLRWLTKGRTLRVLRRIQPTSGGYLEAIPLTSFVVMALVGASGGRKSPESALQVVNEGVRFLVHSLRPDGSWPIDTNLATWVTTLSVNALVTEGDLDSLESIDSRKAIQSWLLEQQCRQRHAYTGAAPGGWAWTDLPGGVPDCDDTPGAVLAFIKLGFGTRAFEAMRAGLAWTATMHNRDGGFPTFCRGWGMLPFDRSGCDLTAHVLRSRIDRTADSKLIEAAFAYLSREQRPDGSWLPLWFGNQHAKDDINPVYGTSRVLAAYRDLNLTDSPECQRGVNFLLSVQNADGGWGGDKDCPSSVEETALAVEVLVDLASGGRQPTGDSVNRGPDAPRSPVQRGLAWLVEAVESGRFREPSPIGFYFAKLWYYEKLYPLIFTVAALGRAVRH